MKGDRLLKKDVRSLAKESTVWKLLNDRGRRKTVELRLGIAELAGVDTGRCHALRSEDRYARTVQVVS